MDNPFPRFFKGNGEPSTSPTPSIGNRLLSFPQAMEEVIRGRKVTRLEWQTNDVYGVLRDGYLMIHKDDGKDWQWIISDGDMEAIDWLTLPEGA